YI
ncbi:hypothetical protein N499_1366B, partial [Wolbachia pipientis wVitA]